MDKYTEIMVEIEHTDNPRQAIETLQRLVCGVCEDGPPREGIQWAAAYLAALADYQNPKQLPLLSEYSEVAEALNYLIIDVQQDLEANWAAWRADIDRRHADKMKEDN